VLRTLINGVESDAVEEIGGITGGGANYSLETSAVPAVFRQAMDCLAPIGVCRLVAAAPLGTEVNLDMNNILIPGRTVRGIVEGDSVPDVFIPRLIEVYNKGRFPFDRLIEFYDLQELNQAAKDAEEGTAIKPVIRMP
jgi:aryl-alcohol dehydrogenase